MSSKSPPTIIESVMNSCVSTGYDPFKELIKIAQEKETLTIKGKELQVYTATKQERITIAREIAKYLQPTVKSKDSEGKGNATFNITVKNFTSKEIKEADVELEETKSTTATT